MIKHLRTKQEYSDLYDKTTISYCRDIEKLWFDPKHKGKKLSKRQLASLFEFQLHFITGEKYLKKEEVINKWIQRDEERDRLLEETPPPELIRCGTCNSLMESESKHLWGDKDDRVLFFFVCPNKCLPNKGIFDNGEVWKSTPTLCKKCNSEMTRKPEEVKNKIATTKYICTNCNHSFVDKFGLRTKKEKPDPNFERDKARFCLDKEKGDKYLDFKRRMEGIAEIIDEHKEKEKNKDLYKKVKKLNKLTIPQFKEFIVSILKDTHYSNLIFDKPDMDRIVSLAFTIEDSKTENEYGSKNNLKKLLKEKLEDTNWRLMSEGISYRLGVLSGKFRIYEKDDDLINLIK